MTSTELRRLVDEGGDQAAIDLLRAADGDAPSREARARTMAALSVGVGLGAGALLATSHAKGLWGIAWKWVGLLALGSGVVVAIGIARHHDEPAPTTEHLAEVAPSLAAPIAATIAPIASATSIEAPRIAPTTEPSHVATTDTIAVKTRAIVSATPTSSAPRASASNQGLSAELASLDASRAALASGNPAAALDQLDHHERTFPNGALAQEATMLRIEALMTKGDRARATKLGNAFIAAHPNSAYTDRVHTLLHEVQTP